jgi:hypothetical protein
MIIRFLLLLIAAGWSIFICSNTEDIVINYVGDEKMGAIINHLMGVFYFSVIIRVYQFLMAEDKNWKKS